MRGPSGCATCGCLVAGAILVAILMGLFGVGSVSAQGGSNGMGYERSGLGYTTWRQYRQSQYVYQNELYLYQSGSPNGSTYRVNRAYQNYQANLHSKIGSGW